MSNSKNKKMSANFGPKYKGEKPPATTETIRPPEAVIDEEAGETALELAGVDDPSQGEQGSQEDIIITQQLRKNYELRKTAAKAQIVATMRSELQGLKGAALSAKEAKIQYLEEQIANKLAGYVNEDRLDTVVEDAAEEEGVIFTDRDEDMSELETYEQKVKDDIAARRLVAEYIMDLTKPLESVPAADVDPSNERAANRLREPSSEVELAKYVKKALLAQATGDEESAKLIMDNIESFIKNFKEAKQKELVNSGLNEELAQKDADEYAAKLIKDLLSTKVSERDKIQYLSVKAARESMDEAKLSYYSLHDTIVRSDKFMTPDQARELNALWEKYINLANEYTKQDNVLAHMMGVADRPDHKKHGENTPTAFFDLDWVAPDSNSQLICTKPDKKSIRSKEQSSNSEISIEEIELAVSYRSTLNKLLEDLSRVKNDEERTRIVADIEQLKSNQYRDLGNLNGDELDSLVGLATAELPETNALGRAELRSSLLESIRSNHGNRIIFDHLFTDILRLYNVNTKANSNDTAANLRAESKVTVNSGLDTVLLKLKSITGVDWPNDIETIDAIANSVKAELNREIRDRAHQTCEARSPERKKTVRNIARMVITNLGDLADNGMQALMGFWPLSLGDGWLAWRNATRENTLQQRREETADAYIGASDSKLVKTWEEYILSMRKLRAQSWAKESKYWSLM